MQLNLTNNRPVAYVRPVREEEVEDVMHQFCEPHYGVVGEGMTRPFMVATVVRTLVVAALKKGFRVCWVH